MRIIMLYLTTNCSVRFEIDTFTHNDHNGYDNFFTNLTEKRLSYQNGKFISLTFTIFPSLWLS